MITDRQLIEDLLSALEYHQEQTRPIHFTTIAIQAAREHLRTALADQPAEQEPAALGPLAKRRVFDYIRGAYDLGYNDARNARAIPGDNAPGYKGRDVEADHGGALFNALRACITAPQPAKREPLTEEQQIAEDLRFHGLTLVKTPTGYAVLKLGNVTANDTGETK